MSVAQDEWVWVPFHVEARFDGLRVDRFLAQRLTAYSRNRVQQMLTTSRVMRDERPLKASSRVHNGDRILIAYPRRPEAPLAEDATLPVLYEDESLLLVNKPGDLLSHPTDKIANNTVLGILRHSRSDLGKLHLLHRLDRETSGVLALAKTSEAARRWTKNMEARRIKKQYIALVAGELSAREGRIDAPIGRERGEIKVRQAVKGNGAVPAVTRYQVLTSDSDFSVVRLYPETGRLHQIRVHMAHIGHPLLGDVLYNGDGSLYLKMARRKLVPEERLSTGFPRLALHAEQLTFSHPMTDQLLTVKAPLPADLQGKIDKLVAR
jgi:23S rRNA pseudouridine1911/1915/1917 synthase